MKEVSQLLSLCSVRPGQSLREGIAAIDRGNIQLALVLDASQRLIGLVTDGDIRRAILSGADLETPLDIVMCRNFRAVDGNVGRVEVLELMTSLNIKHVPILDECGQLLGMHLLQSLVSRQERPNAALLLAGGRGRRLMPLTDSVPKPMLPVAGRPILERLLLHVLGFGIRRFYFSVNYLADQIENHFGDGSQYGCKITYLREKLPLGTGGPLALLRDELEECLLVANGDLVTQANIGHLLDHHLESSNLATIGVRPYQVEIPFGCVTVERGCVTALEEKPTLTKQVNTGIYVFDKAALSDVPKETNYPITELLGALIAQGHKVGAYEIEDDWLDVGQREQLSLARGLDHFNS